MEALREFHQARMAPLSHEQEQLWILQQLRPETPLGNMCTAVTLRGPLRVDALRESLAALLRRHEIWRTIFPRLDGRPVQLVQAQGQWTWSVADLRALPEAEREQEALRRAGDEVKQPFDLARGPLVRVLLIRLGPGEHRLFVTLHHIISDRVSLTHVFLPELAELYEARAQGRSDVLGGVELQYADYAAWQRAERQERELGAHLAFWTEYLAGAPTLLALPGDRRRPGQQSHRGGMQAFALGGKLTATLRKLSRQEHVTLRMTLTAALETLLYRYTGQEHFLVGLMTSWRRPGPQRTAGCLHRHDGAAGRPGRAAERPRAAAKDAGGQRGDAHSPAGAPGRDRASGATGAEPGLPAAGAGTAGVRAAAAVTARGMAARRRSRFPRRRRPFDLCLEIHEGTEGLKGRFIYNSDLFGPGNDQADDRALADAAGGDGRGAVAAGGRARAARRAGDEAAEGVGHRTGDRPPGPGIEQLIEEQARERPAAVAVSCEGEQLSYRELDRRANQLAWYLRERGAGAGALVGVCLERSLDQVIALLAILKAGAAYVPLDPEAPRRADPVRDAGHPDGLPAEPAAAAGNCRRDRSGGSEPGP